ncbi:osteopetrosis-associated transmembrane protein 1-like [Styela clava]
MMMACDKLFPIFVVLFYFTFITGVYSSGNMFHNSGADHSEETLFSGALGNVVFAEESWVKGRTDPSGGISEKCMKLLDSFSNSTSDFLTCILNYSRPLHYCEKCVSEFVDVLNTYAAICSDGENGTTCQDELLRADNVQVILLAYDFVETVWDKSTCHNCYNSSVNKNGTTEYKPTEETLLMLDEIDEVQKCFQDFAEDTADNATVCDVCKKLYSNANKYYNMLDEEGKLCSDLKDSMNYTRRMWSKKFKCTVAQRNDLVIYGMAVAVGFFPVILYVGAFVYGKLQEKKCKSTRQRATGSSRQRVILSESVNPESES